MSTNAFTERGIVGQIAIGSVTASVPRGAAGALAARFGSGIPVRGSVWFGALRTVSRPRSSG